MKFIMCIKRNEICKSKQIFVGNYSRIFREHLEDVAYLSQLPTVSPRTTDVMKHATIPSPIKPQNADGGDVKRGE